MISDSFMEWNQRRILWSWILDWKCMKSAFHSRFLLLLVSLQLISHAELNPHITKSPWILIHFDDGAGKSHFLFAHHVMVHFLTESKLERARIYLKSDFCHANRQMVRIEGSLSVFFWHQTLSSTILKKIILKHPIFFGFLPNFDMSNHSLLVQVTYK